MGRKAHLASNFSLSGCLNIEMRTEIVSLRGGDSRRGNLPVSPMMIHNASINEISPFSRYF